MKLSNDEIIAKLLGELPELVETADQCDINDNYLDYLAGIVHRTQSVLRMMGVEESVINEVSGSMVDC